MADHDWIGGAELAERTMQIFGSTEQLKDWLLLRLANGRITARAKSCLIHRRGSDAAERIADWDIPPKAWSFISLAEDCAYRVELSDDLQFLSGPFFPPACLDMDYGTRKFECSGLLFARHNLDAVLGPHQPIPAATTKPTGPGGRRADKEKWSTFAAAFAVIAAKDDFEQEVDAAAIYERIQTVLRDEDEPCFVLENVRDSITIAMAWRKGIKLKKSAMPS